MSHRSNGKHRFPVSEPSSRLPSTNVQADDSWLSSVESGLTQAHEVFVARASSFIRERPGTSLVVAAAIGGLIGWLINAAAR